jgi:hypothetical protein
MHFVPPPDSNFTTVLFYQSQTVVTTYCSNLKTEASE